MELFNLKNDKVEEVELKPFKLEKDIQSLVEKNTETFFIQSSKIIYYK